jgi:XRE family transcriptional regulator, regulator of sulfur utilization
MFKANALEPRDQMTGEAFDAKALASAFGGRLRELRVREGLTQDRLAKRSGLQASVIGRLERGQHEPLLSTVLSLARGLAVSPGEFLDTLADLPRGHRQPPRSPATGSTFPERWSTSARSTSSKPRRKS